MVIIYKSNGIEGRAFSLPFVIYFFDVTGPTVSVTLQISVMNNMFKMGTASYLPLETAKVLLVLECLWRRSG